MFLDVFSVLFVVSSGLGPIKKKKKTWCLYVFIPVATLKPIKVPLEKWLRGCLK